MFAEVPNKVDFTELESKVIDYWNKERIFRKTLDKPAPKGPYIFYEGPPTANGRPGVHHVLARAFKDLFPRFKTMQGYFVDRKGGWDTHGLPVELEVEKKLGFTKKSDIDEFGIAKFNELCRKSAFEYIQDWNALTERIAFWVNLDDAYVTYENDYIETCWWVMKSMFDRGLLVENYKSTWHCPRNNTSLASHEVSLGYREDVEDPSVYPKFPLHAEALIERGLLETASRRVYLLAWTTTPWTVPANVALAVKPDADYGLYEAPRTQDSTEKDLYILASGPAERALGEGSYRQLKSFKGSDLVGLSYDPILRARAEEGEDLHGAFRVVADEQVTIDDGTGVLHIAPAYGDLELGQKHGLPMLFSVDLLGKTYPEVRPADQPAGGDGPYAGTFFKDVDAAITKDMLERSLFYRAGTVRHTYPFNWRDGTPLINYAKKSWYIRTSLLRDKLVANNSRINWTPEHIRDGRFGDWLENNVDWALSRERYWGAPLPIWESEDGSERLCVGSVGELSQLAGRDLTGLDLHRPYVDEIIFERGGKTFKRVPYTVDVWFESGAMPYAQWHYPFDNQGVLEANFPADFICEAIDQTRGWFYSLHALATLLTDSGDEQRPPGALAHIESDTGAYRNVICLGHVVDENGEKMSKSKGNVVNPWDVINSSGADALRWYLYSATPPGNQKRFSSKLVEETLRDFFMTLWNTYSFFVLYANLDKPELTSSLPLGERPEIDRWLTAKTHALTRDVTAHLEDYDPTSATRMIRDFVVDNLSNWYVRRNRRRFWKSENDSDKLAAYKTLYETLVTLAKLLGPMTPFLSETLYQNLVKTVDVSAPESVHLSDWPTFDPASIDETLLRDMNTLIRIVELGRSARASYQVKTRQPLSEALVRVRSQDELAGLRRLEDQLKEELNVKAVTYLDVTADFVDYTVKPNLPLLGKRLGKRLPALRARLEQMDGREIAKNVREQRPTTIELEGELLELEPEAFLLDAKSPEGYAAVEDRGYLAALNTSLTGELVREGMARDVIRHVQNARKNAGLDVSDTIHLGLESGADLHQAIDQHLDVIEREVLAASVTFAAVTEPLYSEQVNVDGETLTITLQKAQAAPAGVN